MNWLYGVDAAFGVGRAGEGRCADGEKQLESQVGLA